VTAGEGVEVIGNWVVRRLAVGSIARLCDKSELIDFAKMTTLTFDRYEVF
jgi:hypothetical protein